MVTTGSDKPAWWLCPVCGYEWRASVGSRVRGNGCAVCAGQEVLKGYNDLESNYPEIAKEWHPTLNGSLKPSDVTCHNDQRIFWICEHGHIWPSIIAHRTNGTGCPICNVSKGEKEVLELLKKHNIVFKIQYKFDNCKYERPLPFDFAIMNTKNELVFLIEYDGKQHFEPIDFANKGEKWAKEQFELVQTKDKIKNNYCKKNNIPLLRIPYTEFDSIEEILLKELKKYNLL